MSIEKLIHETRWDMDKVIVAKINEIVEALNAEKAECPQCNGKKSVLIGLPSHRIPCPTCSGKLSTSGEEEVFKALGKVVRTVNNEIIAITYEGKQYFPKELHPATSGMGECCKCKHFSPNIKVEEISPYCNPTDKKCCANYEIREEFK